MSAIPVLDADDTGFDTKLLDACRSIGFAAVTNHGIDAELLTAMRRVCRRLFLLGEDHKRAHMIERGNYRGFIPFGFFTPNRAEINGASPDLYEGFKLHWECPTGHPVRQQCDLYGTNRWVPEVDDMREVIMRYWRECDRLATRLMAVFADHLGVPSMDLDHWFDAPLTNMTLLHYPPHDPGRDLSSMHPHKDTNVLTILQPDAGGGLQVRSASGQWIELAPEFPALAVNIGEMLELWSGGEFVATPHRAVNRTSDHRYAFPWFLVPRHDVTVAPLVDCVHGYLPTDMPVGDLSSEVWRTNWPDEPPSTANFDLGSLDR